MEVHKTINTHGKAEKLGMSLAFQAQIGRYLESLRIETSVSTSRDAIYKASRMIKIIEFFCASVF